MNVLEFKSSLSADDVGTITGTAWPFGSPDRVGDVIEPGAFAGAQAPLPMLFGHDPDDVVGVWQSVEETGAGLIVKGKLLVDELPRAREVHTLVRTGAVRGLSIGFSTKKAAPRRGTTGRTISALELVEISIVSVPSHPGARVTAAKTGFDAIAIAEAINRAACAFKRT